MKKNPARAALLTAALIIVVPAFMRAQVADFNSRQRADAVKTQLITMGIDAGRLTANGFGDTKPLNDNNTQEGKANNRRVEFVKL